MQEKSLTEAFLGNETTKQPLVSVIMPCYNAASFLREAIDSIISQTYQHLEIIIINDGSTDGSLAIIEEYANDDSRIILINHSGNEGLVCSLNEGVLEASGEYIARMDADDISAINRIEILLNHLLLHPELDVVSSGFYYINANGHRSIPIKPKGTLPLALKFFSFYATPIAHACALGKSKCFQMFSYDQRFIHSEDYDLFSRMAISDTKLYNLTLPLYSIRIHPNRVSERFEEHQVKSHLCISKRNIKKYFGLKVENLIHAIAANRNIGDANSNDIKLAMQFIKKTKALYVAQERCTTEEEKEIENFVNEQYTDIIIQTLKNSSFAHRLKLLTMLFNYLLLLIFKPNILNYILRKIALKL